MACPHLATARAPAVISCSCSSRDTARTPPVLITQECRTVCRYLAVFTGSTGEQACVQRLTLRAHAAAAASQGNSSGGVAFALLNAAESSLKLGFLPEDANHSAFSTLLNRCAPTEVLLPAAQHNKQVGRCLEFNAPDAQVTRAPADDCVSPDAAVAALEGAAAMAPLLRGLEAHVEGARRPEVASAMALLMAHLKRMHLLDQLSPEVLQVPSRLPAFFRERHSLCVPAQLLRTHCCVPAQLSC